MSLFRFAVFLSLAFAEIVTFSDGIGRTHPSSIVQDTWSRYETGELFLFDSTRDACTKQAREKFDSEQPCSAMRPFFLNCSLGIDAQQVKGTGIGAYSLEKLSNEAQQACYCNSDYWEWNLGCDHCLIREGFEADIGNDGLLSEHYVHAQQHDYCTGEPVLNFEEFLSNWRPVSPEPTVTSIVTYRPPHVDNSTSTWTTSASSVPFIPTATPSFGSGTVDAKLLDAYHETYTGGPLIGVPASFVTPTSSVTSTTWPSWTSIGFATHSLLTSEASPSETSNIAAPVVRRADLLWFGLGAAILAMW